MNISELNQYISDGINRIESANSYNGKDVSASPEKVAGVSTTFELKALWLAAAQAAKLAEYTCSGKLVECSVLGLNYNETKGTGGLFRDKIVGTNTYKNYIKK